MLTWRPPPSMLTLPPLPALLAVCLWTPTLLDQLVDPNEWVSAVCAIFALQEFIFLLLRLEYLCALLCCNIWNIFGLLVGQYGLYKMLLHLNFAYVLKGGDGIVWVSRQCTCLCVCVHELRRFLLSSEVSMAIFAHKNINMFHKNGMLVCVVV